MSTSRDRATIVGVGAAACVACCAGPIIAFLAAIGIGTIAFIALFGTIGFALAGVGVVGVVRHRRRRSVACSAATIRETVDVQITRATH